MRLYGLCTEISLFFGLFYRLFKDVVSVEFEKKTIALKRLYFLKLFKKFIVGIYLTTAFVSWEI